MITARQLWPIAQVVSEVFPDAELSPILDRTGARFWINRLEVSFVVEGDLSHIRLIRPPHKGGCDLFDLGFGELKARLEMIAELL